MAGRTKKQKPGAWSSPSPPPQEEGRTSSLYQRKTHQELEPSTSENASAQDSWRPSGDSRWQPSGRLPPRGTKERKRSSDDEGSPEETRKIPVQTNLNLNRGIDYKAVLLSVIVSAAVLAVVLAKSGSRQSDPIYVPVRTQDAEALKAIQMMRGEFDGKLAKLPILDASEVQDIVKSTLKPYMDHIENHLLQDRLKQIAEKWLASKLQKRDHDLSQKLNDMEDRFGEKLYEEISPSDDDLKAEVGKLLEMVRRLVQRRDLHGDQCATEKLQEVVMQACSLLLAVVALVVACSSRTARPAAPAPSSANPPSNTAANPPPTTAANPPPTSAANTPPTTVANTSPTTVANTPHNPAANTGPVQVSNTTLEQMGPFVADLVQREKKEREALSQWRGTLERTVCVVHFGREFQQHHRQLTQRVMQGVTQGRLLDATVDKTEDIAKVPGARLYVLFVNFNERNVILETPEKGTEYLRLITVQALQRRGAEVVVIYAGIKESADLPAGQLYNRHLTSVQSHPVLSQLSSKQHFLSIDTDFLEHQHQHLQQVVKAALN